MILLLLNGGRLNRLSADNDDDIVLAGTAGVYRVLDSNIFDVLC